VEELSKAVDVAEKNTAKFGLTQADIMARRKWIMQTKREVH
jgi:Syntaxin 6, N-terminal